MAAKRGRTLSAFGQAFTPLSVSGGHRPTVAVVDLTLPDRTLVLTLRPRSYSALTLDDRLFVLTLEKK